ncbi:MAG TPA: hypothetical protein V6D17_25265 [Candidatus Obscuribacterales bacterium]
MTLSLQSQSLSANNQNTALVSQAASPAIPYMSPQSQSMAMNGQRSSQFPLPRTPGSLSEVQASSPTANSESLPATNLDERSNFLANATFVQCYKELSAMKQMLNGPASTHLEKAIEQTAKELAIASIYLTGLECGGASIEGWLLDFLFSALRACDLIYKEPGARDTVQRYGSLAAQYIVQCVCANADARLNMGPQLTARLYQGIVSSQRSRYQLLEASLTWSPGDLNQYMLINKLAHVAFSKQ